MSAKNTELSNQEMVKDIFREYLFSRKILTTYIKSFLSITFLLDFLLYGVTLFVVFIHLQTLVYGI